jgi:hypothetical protein
MKSSMRCKSSGMKSRLKDHLSTEARESLDITKAQELDVILLSLNGDFADIVAYSPARLKGIVAL